MTQVQRLVAGIDLGTTKVTGIIGEVTGDARAPGVKVLGVGIERTAGIRRGVVRDIEETTRAVAKAMRDAQLMAGVEVGTAYVSNSGEHVSGRNSHGVVSVTGSEIRTSDVARVNDIASNISFGPGHELLHAIPQDYIVDHQGGITDPIGMTGSRLEAEVYLVTVLATALQNIRRCVEKAVAFAGVSIRAYRLLAFVIAGLYAGLAGSFLPPLENTVTPPIAHWTHSAEPVMVTLLGGIHTFSGPIVGSVLFYIIKDIIARFTHYWLILFGSIVILLVLVFRGGVVIFFTENILPRLKKNNWKKIEWKNCSEQKN